MFSTESLLFYWVYRYIITKTSKKEKNASNFDYFHSIINNQEFSGACINYNETSFKDCFSISIRAKEVIHSKTALRDIRLYLPNLAKPNLANCTVRRP